MKTLRGLGRNSSFQKGSNGPHTVDGEAKATSSAINGAQAQKKRQTPEEVALTAKNYRLAKELSELRVKHREECKNNSRLQMENMSLASRCREAIRQAAALKKELARHQPNGKHTNRTQRSSSKSRSTDKDASTALNVQTSISEPQQPNLDALPPSTEVPMPSPSTCSGLGSSTSPESKAIIHKARELVANLKNVSETVEVSKENSTHPVQPKDTSTSSSSSSSSKISQQSSMANKEQAALASQIRPKPRPSAKVSTVEIKPQHRLFSEPKIRAKAPAPSSFVSVIEQARLMQKLEMEEIHKSVGGASPTQSPIKAVDSSDFEDSEDGHIDSIGITLSAEEARDHFMSAPPLQQRPTINQHNRTSLKHRNYNEEFPEDISVSSTSSHGKTNVSLLSSIDAFEASFTQDFPDTFSPKNSEDDKKPLDTYDPFNTASPMASPIRGISYQGKNDALLHPSHSVDHIYSQSDMSPARSLSHDEYLAVTTPSPNKRASSKTGTTSSFPGSQAPPSPISFLRPHKEMYSSHLSDTQQTDPPTFGRTQHATAITSRTGVFQPELDSTSASTRTNISTSIPIFRGKSADDGFGSSSVSMAVNLVHRGPVSPKDSGLSLTEGPQYSFDALSYEEVDEIPMNSALSPARKNAHIASEMYGDV